MLVGQKFWGDQFPEFLSGAINPGAGVFRLCPCHAMASSSESGGNTSHGNCGVESDSSRLSPEFGQILAKPVTYPSVSMSAAFTRESKVWQESNEGRSAAPLALTFQGKILSRNRCSQPRRW